MVAPPTARYVPFRLGGPDGPFWRWQPGPGSTHYGAVKEYKAIVWPRESDDVPGERVSFWAETVEEAAAQLKAQYGEGIVYTLWNDEDAAKPR
jgi:hypothetical protein